MDNIPSLSTRSLTHYSSRDKDCRSPYKHEILIHYNTLLTPRRSCSIKAWIGSSNEDESDFDPNSPSKASP